MEWILRLHLYLYSVSGVAIAFNVEPAAWKQYRSSAFGFGYKVTQTSSSRLLVSAPLEVYEQDRRGRVYSCPIESASCSPVLMPVPGHGVNMSLGLSMTYDTRTSKALVCGPTVPRDCGSITTYNGMCFEIEKEKQGGLAVPPVLRDCPGTKVDIGFLLDGSGSVNSDQFNSMKRFVTTLIKQFLGRDTQFGIAQYSYECEIHLDFKGFNEKNNGWEREINQISQLGGGTNTASAIRKVVGEMFSQRGGARSNANRVLLVITDGESHDKHLLRTAAAEAEAKNIIRFAIGVGDAFNRRSATKELETIASSPISKHMFKVGDFKALDQLRSTLQKNIFAIEGAGESFEMELAQEGFSAEISPSGQILLGAVGALQWKGGYQENPQNPQPITDDTLEPDSYLGYSMATAVTRTGNYIVLGAPRYKHMGRVIIFPIKQRLDQNPGQIGAFFGAEVCAVNLDSDPYTDLLLLSAPTYTYKDGEGVVEVYTFSDQSGVTGPQGILKGAPGVTGRFGASLAALSDLNGDNFKDVAVGAPLENDGEGSVYIFSGVRGGINPIFSQRILGSSAQSGLKHFGLSIGMFSLDQSGDSLPDLAVGSNGTVLILRSRPMVEVQTTVTYKPSKIPTQQMTCKVLNATATVCFQMIPITTSNPDLEAQISYTLTLDATRLLFRAYFEAKNNVYARTIRLKTDKKCSEHSFNIEGCPEDALNPLVNELKFTFEGLPSDRTGNLRQILSPRSPTTTHHNMDFEVNCGTDNKCVDDLRMDFNFSGASELKVGIMLELNVTVMVTNLGENSYNSYVILTYPAGLSYRRFTRQGRVECSSLDSEDENIRGKSICFIDKPIFKNKAKAFFTISYGIDSNSNFDQKVNVTANVTSGNEEHSKISENFKIQEIPVKYSIFVVIRSEDSTPYINFTAGQNDLQKVIKQNFAVLNALRELNLTVTIKVPIQLGEKDIWVDPGLLQITGCQRVMDEKPNVSNFVEKLKSTPVVDCSVSLCAVFECGVNGLKRDALRHFNVSGNMSSGWIQQVGLTKVEFTLVSTATFNFDRNRFIFFSSDSQNNPPITKIVTVVEVYTEADFTKEIIGGVVGGLLLLALIAAGLYKAGFFNSKYKQMMEESKQEDP